MRRLSDGDNGSCERVKCKRISDGTYDIIGLFNIELCTGCAIELRDFEFLDLGLSAQIIEYQALMAGVAANVGRTNIDNALNAILHHRRGIYETIMEWLKT